MIRGLRYKGKPCRHGHDGIRYVNTNICVACSEERNLKLKRPPKVYSNDPEVQVAMAKLAELAKEKRKLTRERRRKAKADRLLEELGL